MYALVQNGEVISKGVPSCECVNGCVTFGFDKLPAETLKAFGYLPYTEDIPEYDPETQHPVFDHYNKPIVDNVIAYYRIESKPPSTEEVLSDLVQSLAAKGVLP